MGECPICCGRKTITLPVYKRVSASYSTSDISTALVKDDRRTYPCPECSHTKADEDSVFVVQSRKTVDSRYPAEVIDYAKKDIAHEMARFFMENGMIGFFVKEDTDNFVINITGMLGVVRPAKVASINTRALTAAKGILDLALSRAIASIRVWGSHYTGDEGNISKAQAVSSISKAFNEVVSESYEETELK